LEDISRYARRGAGSASRAVTGGFSRWFAGSSDEDSYARQLAGPEQLNMGIIVALIPAHKFTDNAHKDVVTSPFFRARLEYVVDALDKMERAIYARDIDRICSLAETDTLLLHGITMTGIGEHFLWRPETVKVILEVKRMRSEGLMAYFSIDTGATVYINCSLESRKEVRSRIEALGIQTIECNVGGASKIVNEHLF
jgi:phosphomevalonate decarboxylase